MSVYYDEVREAWYMRFQVKGIRVHKPTGARTKAASVTAENAEIQRILESRGDPRDRLARKALTLKEFSTQFLEFVEKHQTFEPRTKTFYKHGWKMLEATDIIHRRMDAIIPSDVNLLEFPGCSGSYANQALTTLSRMLSLAAERKYIAAAPKIPKRKARARQSFVTELWMEELLLRHASPTLHDFMIVMFDAGARPDEVCRIRREHILWAAKAIYIPKGKTENAERHIPLTDRMEAMLRRRLASHDSEWVFPSKNTEARARSRRAQELQAKGLTIAEIAEVLQVHPRSVYGILQGFRQGKPSAIEHVKPASMGGKAWMRLRADANAELQRSGLPPLPDDLVLYSCRHTFASHFVVQSGDNRPALKKIMGHSSLRVSERYIHAGVGKWAEIMNNFNTERRKLRPVELKKEA